MKFLPFNPFAALLVTAIALCGCDDKKPASVVAPLTPTTAALVEKDTPLLPVKIGDTWNYRVLVEIAPGVTAPDADEVQVTSKRTRTYIGKIRLEVDSPELDCFEVTTADTPPERELVEIHEDRILMRGSLVMAPDRKPLIYDKPVPFIIAGMRAGTQFHEISLSDGLNTRQIQTVGRESVTVPAGTFEAVRLMMTGKDGEFDLRRTIWFAPRTGIVREEQARYAVEKLLYREVHELVSFTAGG
jgi:hypothetical protein